MSARNEDMLFWKYGKGGNACILEILNFRRMARSKKDWRSSEYLKRNQGLYAREDGRHWNEDGRRCSEVLKSSYMKTVVK